MFYHSNNFLISFEIGSILSIKTSDNLFFKFRKVFSIEFNYRIFLNFDFLNLNKYPNKFSASGLSVKLLITPGRR